MARMTTVALDELTRAKLSEIVSIRHESDPGGFWDRLAQREIGAEERAAISHIVRKLSGYGTHRVNEATIWARAIYPLLALAERDDIRAWSLVPLAGKFGDIELRGEVDGALARSFAEEIELPYFVVVEAKRGFGGTDPMAQLFGAMLCAAQQNERAGEPVQEIFGCYTVADVWTFVRGTLDWQEPKPTMSVLPSREYTEKSEAIVILAILESILAEAGV
ncbi:MAG: hypothetical protein U0359_38315 [Byssovorax sp.]